MARPDDDEGAGTAAATVASSPGTGRPTTGRSAPFVGTAAYEVDDAPFFIGRSGETETVVAKLRTSRLTVLYGASGTGRTSLLLAGVVARLHEEARDAQDGTPLEIAVVRAWDGDPRRAVEAAARAALERLDGDEPLPARAATLAETLANWTERRGTLLLVLDQFEEHLLRHEDRTDGALSGFSAELVRLVRARQARVHLLVSVREDAWPELARFDGHLPPALVDYVRLDPLHHDVAWDAVEGAVFAWDRMLPAGADPYYVEGALADQVLPLAAAGVDEVETTIVQILLARLWQATVAEGARALTVARLESLGADRVVRDHVVDSLGRLSKRDRTTAAACFRYLVTDGTSPLAQRAADLAAWTHRSPAQVAALLDRLCAGEGGRLLRAVADEQGRRYELFHPLLAAPIATWRDDHDLERKRTTRQRARRIGVVALAVIAVASAVGAWAVDNWTSTNRHYHQAQRAERTLRARISQLTAAQRAAAAEAAVVDRLARQNDAVAAQTATLEQARAGLDARIASLRTQNERFVTAITTLNASNAALAKQITSLDAAFRGLGAAASSGTAASTLAAELTADSAAITTLKTQNVALARKAAILGYRPPASPSAPTQPATKPSPVKPTTAPSFPVVSDFSGHDTIRGRVDALDKQLAALAQSGRPADRLRLVRQERTLLVQERSALAQENRELNATRVALRTRYDALKRSHEEALAEHGTLARRAAADQARNAKRASDLAGTQGKTTNQIAALAAAQRALAAARAENANLVSELDQQAKALASASLDATADPQLAGLLALEADRLVPDDSAYVQVYDALWRALNKLDQAAAAKAAPQTATLQKALCARISRPLTQAEWQQYLPAGAPYGAAAANPCT